MDEPEDETADWPCLKCCAVNSHWLICPTLRLPAGYRISDDPELDPGLADPQGEPPPCGVGIMDGHRTGTRS